MEYCSEFDVCLLNSNYEYIKNNDRSTYKMHLQTIELLNKKLYDLINTQCEKKFCTDIKLKILSIKNLQKQFFNDL